MKTTTVFILIFVLLSFSCEKDDDRSKNPIDWLPAATQTGAQTFGCLINGEVFIPEKFGSLRPYAFYQFVDGAYTLGLGGARKDGSGKDFKSLSLGAIDVQAMKEGEYELKSQESKNFSGQYLLGGGVVLRSFTTDVNPGKVVITRLDDKEFIISGTFEFTVLDNDGNEIQITDGRFDLNYTN